MELYLQPISVLNYFRNKIYLKQLSNYEDIDLH
jgi:hypothetical protein